MDFEAVKKQLIAKHRTLDDLLRFIKTRADSHPNYTLLLGAGCSISSGVRPATTLCNLWRNEIIKVNEPSLVTKPVDAQREYLKINHGDWYDPQREYSSLFERKYDLQRQRRMFVENEVKNAIPSIGYAYLTALVGQEYFNTIFTTNFDDLVNEAFFLYGKQRPIVCAHDSSINSVTITSKRPKVIKLHGDYLFDDIKATDRETESLGQNMKEKFIEFAKDYGLVVVGYAGGDRSIIDVITLLLKNEDYFKNGIYWCVRKGSDISEDLRRLFWKDRVYFVEIDGFDELFAHMYSEFNDGECLPPSASEVSNEHESVVKKLLSVPNAFPETSEVLKQARKRLMRQSKRKAIANLIINSEQKEKPLSNSVYSDDELLCIKNLERLFSEKKYEELINLAKTQLSAVNKPDFHSRVATLLINANLSIRQKDEALRVLDDCRKQEPKNINWSLMRARIVSSRSEKFVAINEACNCNDESSEAFRRLGEWYKDQIDSVPEEQKKDTLQKAIDAYKKSLRLEPSKRNSAWSNLHSLYLDEYFDKIKRNTALNALEDDLSSQGLRGWRLLTLKANRIDRETERTFVEKLISSIEDAEFNEINDDKYYFRRLKLKIYTKIGDVAKVKEVTDALLGLNKHSADAGLALDISNALRKIQGNDLKAKDVLLENLNSDEFDADVFIACIDACLALNLISEAETIFNSHRDLIYEVFELKIQGDIEEAKGDYSRALITLGKIESLQDKTNASIRSYLLLLDKKYDEAKKVCQAYLEGINYMGTAVAEIVNFELARKKLGAKPDNGRLDNALKSDSTPRAKAAIAALKGHKKEAIDHIREELKFDKTFKVNVERWPVFEEIRNETSLREILERLKPH